MGLLIVSPYLAYVALVEGLAEHVRVGLEFGKAEQHQVLWGLPDLTPEEGGLQVVLFGRALSPEALLLWMYSAVGLALTVLLFTSRGTPELPPMVALWFFTVAFRVVILRHPLRARLPDVAVVAAMGWCDRGCWLCFDGFRRGGGRVPRGPSRRRPLPWPSRPWRLRASGLSSTSAIAWHKPASLVAPAVPWRRRAASCRGARPARGTRIGPRATFRPSWTIWRDAPRPADRLLITWFAPEVLSLRRPPVCRRAVAVLPASRLRPSAIRRSCSRASVPRRSRSCSSTRPTARSSRGRFRALSAFIDATYTIRAHFPRDEDTSIAIGVRNDLHPRTSFGDPPWVCGYE